MNVTIIRGILKFTSQVERLSNDNLLMHNARFDPSVCIYSILQSLNKQIKSTKSLCFHFSGSLRRNLGDEFIQKVFAAGFGLVGVRL